MVGARPGASRRPAGPCHPGETPCLHQRGGREPAADHSTPRSTLEISTRCGASAASHRRRR
jgi:hypothetical protein